MFFSEKLSTLFLHILLLPFYTLGNSLITALFTMVDFDSTSPLSQPDESLIPSAAEDGGAQQDSTNVDSTGDFVATDVQEEDMVMDDVVENPTNTPVVKPVEKPILKPVDKPKVTPISTTTVHEKKNTIAKSIENLRARRLKLSEQYANDVETDSQDETMLQEIMKLNEKIEVMSKVLQGESRQDHSAATLTQAPVGSQQEFFSRRSGLPMTRADVPKFQLVYQTEVYFPNEKRYESVDYFLRQFEKIMVSSGLQVSTVWREIIPISFHNDFDVWVAEELVTVDTWDQAKDLLRKKFGQTMSKIMARKRLMNMRMFAEETIGEYHVRFSKGINEARYKKEESMVADMFFVSLPDYWQTQANTVLAARAVEIDTWTVKDIADALSSVYRDKVPGSIAPSRNGIKRKSDSTSMAAENLTKRPNAPSKTGFYCRKHGGEKASHNEKDCYSITGGNASPVVDKKTPRPGPSNSVGSKNVPRHATSSNIPLICRYCKSTWEHGHRCQAFYDAKRKENKDRNVFSVRKTTNEDIDMTDADIANEDWQNINHALEDEQYDCKLDK